MTTGGNDKLLTYSLARGPLGKKATSAFAVYAKFFSVRMSLLVLLKR